MTAWLAAAYAALALGLAWTLAAKGDWRRRVPFVVCAPAVAVGLWLAVPDTAGFPTSARAPAHAVFVSGVVDEPDPQTSDPGRIYLWLDVGARAPRAYSLPYTRQLHRQVQAALNATKHGVRVAVSRSQGRPGHRHGTGYQRGALRFYPQPPPGLPPKTH